MKSTRKLLPLMAVALLVIAVLLLVRGLRESPPASENPDAPAAIATESTAATRPSTTATQPRPAASEADRRLRAEGAITDVGLTTFPINEYPRLVPPAGTAAGAPSGDAFIHVPSAGNRVALAANQLGEYPPVNTRLNDTIGVRLQLPDVKPGTPVRIVILDGGSFPISSDEKAQLLEAAAWRGVAFEFTTSANIGTHRVLVQAQGQTARILDFTAIDSQGS